nr:hypothetical protein [Methylocystis sp. H4A]
MPMVAALSVMRLGAWKTPAGLRGLAIAADNDRRTKRRAETCGTAKAEGEVATFVSRGEDDLQHIAPDALGGHGSCAPAVPTLPRR